MGKLRTEAKSFLLITFTWLLSACGGSTGGTDIPGSTTGSASSSSNTSSSSSSSTSSGSGSQQPPDPDDLATGSGSIGFEINPASYGCSVDNGNWIFNAGVVEPAINACDPQGDYNGVPQGVPAALRPQLTEDARTRPAGTHRWWGSVAFYGEMPVGDASRSAYITPDPIAARITNRGARLSGIPGALRVLTENDFGSEVPDPFAEVHEGLAVANSAHDDLDALMHNYSDGSVTVQWRGKQSGLVVMEATFVHGSPYAFFEVFDGVPILRTFAADAPQKSLFHSQTSSLGVTTSVSGITNHFLIVGEGDTRFGDLGTTDIRIDSPTKKFTVAILPHNPSPEVIADFLRLARNEVAEVKIDYSVDPDTQAVTIAQRYLDAEGAPIETLAGLMPLQWKNSTQPLTAHKTRSARGVIQFAHTSSFEYTLPFVGVLPTLPAGIGTYDENRLRALVSEFTTQGETRWNPALDTYWSGKNYGKVAELAAIARSIGMTAEADRLIAWLKAELEDWFTAYSDGTLNTTKYFVYDEDWNTLLGLDESFGAHQQLNDHHFHYGYFVRAAAEICRVDKSWCGKEAYGSMVDLLIRDYAAGRDDPYFPYLRNFDPANGFSWASGHANFTRGNNNESTSEAANAYGAMILYGLITDNKTITDRGIYLHASSTASYWEYWNNLDRHRGADADHDNFPAEYEKITTSIIWGNGAVFSTWFSAARAHILGIQGLPLNPLVLHIGLHTDYMIDYIALGLSESANALPSGLPQGQWRDVWWNILAMVDGDAAVDDMENLGFDYAPEEGETKAHTYHWVHTMSVLGAPQLGKQELTADYPAAAAFSKNGSLSYIAYNYSNAEITVNYSDGTQLKVPPNGFSVERQ